MVVEDRILPPKNRFSFGFNFESTLIIAGLTAACWYISTFYASFYYSNLGIYPALLNLSFEETLSKGLVIFGVSLCLCVAIWLGIEASENWSRLGWLFCNSPLFLGLFSFIILYFQYPELYLFLKASLIIGCVMELVYLIYSYRQKKNGIKDFWDSNTIAGVSIIIFVIFASMIPFAIALGTDASKRAIECEMGSCVHISFNFIDHNLSTLNSQDLVLITYHEGKYYVSHQSKPAPKSPEIIVIRDDQISWVKMKKVDNWSDSRQLSFT